ncbi:MAG: hypothetical protein LBV37_01010, partial [Mycoplasmataceae bacterium]|nr:hypothetical protein [Mycoplasmataceae bacterium]
IFSCITLYFASLILIFSKNYNSEFNLWNYQWIWRLKISSSTLNWASWGILLVTLIALTVYFFVRPARIQAQNKHLLIFIVWTMFLFANPLSLNVFLKIQSRGYIFDIGLVNYLIMAPVLLFICSEITHLRVFNNKIKVSYDEHRTH